MGWCVGVSTIYGTILPYHPTNYHTTSNYILSGTIFRPPNEVDDGSDKDSAATDGQVCAASPPTPNQGTDLVTEVAPALPLRERQENSGATHRKGRNKQADHLFFTMVGARSVLSLLISNTEGSTVAWYNYLMNSFECGLKRPQMALTPMTQ